MIHGEKLLREIECLKEQYPLISLMDENGIIIYVSENHKDILGYETNELEGQILTPFIDPIDIDYLTESFIRMINTKKPIETKSKFLRKDGEYAVIRTYTIPRFENGKLLGCIMYSMERKNVNMDSFRKDHVLSEIKFAI